MSDWTIYHNPKCSKSRETLKMLNEYGVEPRIIEYLKDRPSKGELISILEKLESEPSSLVRTKEALFKNLQFNIRSIPEIADILTQYPELIERPIVVHGSRAILGRPPENVKTLFS